MDDIKERIKEVVDKFYDGNVSAASRSFDIQQGTLKNIVGGKLCDPSYDSIVKIIEAKELKINSDWLLLGKGKMINEDPGTDANVIHCPKCVEPCIEDQMINLYDVDAAANLRTMFDHKGENVLDKLKIPNLGKCDGAVYVKGDSMYPLLKSGDIVIYKEVTDLQNDIFFGQMYLISMSIAGDEYVVVKYVNRSEIEGHIKLVSYNKHHDPKDVHLSSIRAMAIVKGSFRYNI